MANQYLIEVHNFISLKIEKAQSEKARAAESDGLIQNDFYDGQLKELTALRAFLKDNFDLVTQRYY